MTKASLNDITWYDNYYHKEQLGLTSWYEAAIPLLKDFLKSENNLLEAGAGVSELLRYLNKENLVKPSNMYACDQSSEAMRVLKDKIPGCNTSTEDLYKTSYTNEKFDFVLLMETIEHLEDPYAGLREISRIIKPKGYLFISFPNYFNVPWYIIRLLSRLLNRPNWINLQPVDKIYTYPLIVHFAGKMGFKFIKSAGSCYYPPLLNRFEPRFFDNLLNSLGLAPLSFHPVLVFQKNEK